MKGLPVLSIRALVLFTAPLWPIASEGQDTVRYVARYRAWLQETGAPNAVRVIFVRDKEGGIEVLADSCGPSFSQQMAGQARYVPVERIERLTFQRRGGNTRAALIGGAGGMILGSLLVWPAVDDADGVEAIGAGATVASGALIGMLIGIPLGLLFGGPRHRYFIEGKKTRYDLIRPDLQFFRPRKVRLTP